MTTTIGYEALVHFTAPDKPFGYGMGFGVTLAVPPKVGDVIRVDQNSIKKIPQEDLHRPLWKIVEWTHELNLDGNLEPGHEKESPQGWLNVVVHPVKEKPAKTVKKKKKGR